MLKFCTDVIKSRDICCCRHVGDQAIPGYTGLVQRVQRVLINYLNISETTFIDNGDTVKLYTGLSSYDILICTYIDLYYLT